MKEQKDMPQSVTKENFHSKYGSFKVYFVHNVPFVSDM